MSRRRTRSVRLVRLLRWRLAAALLGAIMAMAASLATAGSSAPADLRDLDAFLARTSGIADIPARLEAVTRPLLGVPYKVDPLGEGDGGTDAEPLWSFVLCDCQTFVEQGIALAFSRSEAEFRERIRAIRYIDGIVDYERRKHLVAPRWLPTLVKDGYLTESTHSFGGADTATARLTIGDGPLAPKFAKLRKRAGSGWPYGEHTLAYVPLDVAIARVASIPPGTVLLPVKAPRDDIPFLVSHMGLVLKRDGKLIMRHASASPVFKKVVDQSARGYLLFLRRYFATKDRPVVGVALYGVTAPGAMHADGVPVLR